MLKLGIGGRFLKTATVQNNLSRKFIKNYVYFKNGATVG